MPRNFSAALKAHLAQSSTTLTTCWQITRRDGTVHRYTALDADLTIGADVFSSIGAPYSATSYSGNTDLSVDNLDIDWLFGDISRQDILAGLLDDAEVRFWLVNWQDPDASGKMLRGWTGELTVTDDGVKGELRGMLQRLQQRTGLIVSPGCRYDLGDARCGVDLEALAVTGAVTSALIKEDFSVYSLGTQPTGTTRRYNTTNGSFTVVAGTGIGGKHLQYDTTSYVGAVDKMLSIDSLDGTVDVEILAKVRPNHNDDDCMMLYARASGTTNPNYYSVSFGTAFAHCLRLGYHNGASMSALNNIDFGWLVGGWHWVRFRVIGSALKVKAWRDGDPEPSAWMIDRTHTSIDTGGWVGVGGKNSGSTRDADFDYLGVNTDGSTVPVPGTEAAYSDRVKDINRSEPTGYFNGGLLTVVTGENAGASMEIKTWDAAQKTFILYEPLFYSIAEGDEYSAVPGCEKSFAACRDTYSNALKFGGEPHLPGYDVVLQRKQGGVV
jgi:hypothetical protein